MTETGFNWGVYVLGVFALFSYGLLAVAYYLTGKINGTKAR